MMDSTTNMVSTFLPICLGIIMLGFGLSLSVEDFRRIWNYPRTVIIGLFCQMLIVPLLALLLCFAFNFTPELSVGLMILAASPGGVTANIFSHLSHGDVALNLTLTAINSVLAAFTLPLMVNLSLAYFGKGDLEIGLQFKKTIEVFLIVLVPVLLGMALRRKMPALSQKADKPVRIFSLIVLVIIIAVSVMNEKDKLVTSFGQIGVAILLFNLGSMGIGYLVPMLLKVERKAATAIAMEVGIHNGTLAIYIAVSILGSFELALPSAVYSLVMFFTAAVFSLFLAKRNRG